MAQSKNSQEKTELFKTIWNIANTLRGSVDGWEFKAYIFNTLFYRYISEHLTRKINQDEWDAGNSDFNYASISDDTVRNIDGFEEDIINSVGFFLYPSELFCNVAKNATTNPNLNVDLVNIFSNIENSSKTNTNSFRCFGGLFADFIVDNSKLGTTVEKKNKKLAEILGAIANIDFGGEYSDNSADILGDAYEYLMGMYAANAGKSGGEYFTPQEVSELLTKICVIGKDRVNKVYDPTCGSGSLLLKSAKILGKDNVIQGYFGQEINNTTYNLCRMNMILHDIPYEKFNIACEDTLTAPQHWDDEPFEVIVSNPPYSIKWAGDDDVTLINDPRFSPAGVLAPKSKADLAFIMHSLAWLAPNGTAAIVCFPGIMYRGNAEQKIRQYLIDNNYIEAIIQLPSNLFFGTSIATNIMVLKKNKVDNRTMFIDASKEFKKETNQNRLSEENLENILNDYRNRENVEHIVSVVDYEDIVKNKYNLSVSTYVEPEDTTEKIDIKELNENIRKIVERENELRQAIDEIVKELEAE